MAAKEMDVILVLKCVIIRQVVKGLVSHQTGTSTEGMLTREVYNR